MLRQHARARTLPRALAPAAWITAAACTAPGPARPAERGAAAVTQAFASHPALPVGVSPDGRRVLLKRFHAQRFELVVLDRASGRVIARHLSAATQLAPSWRPDGGELAFLAASPGDPRYRLHLLSLATARVRVLAAPPTSVAARPQWSHDGRRLAYAVGDAGRPGRRLAVVPADGSGPAALLPTGDLAPLAEFAWSPEGDALAVVERAAPSQVLLAGLAGWRRTLSSVDGAEIRDLVWAPDGQSVLVAARAPGDEHFRLVQASPDRVREVAREAGDISGAAYLPGGAGYAYHVNVDGERTLHVCRTGEPCRTLGGRRASTAAAGFTPGADSALVVRTTRGQPPALLAIDLRTGGAAAVHAPATPTGAEARRVDVVSTAGVRVPAYVWAGAPGPGAAALIRVHGGPALQAVPGWEVFIPHLAARGGHVVLPNYRGSTGYGARFERQAGGDPGRVADILAVRDWVVDSLGVPPGRIVLFGHSYGALLAAEALAQDPDGFAGAVLVSLVHVPSSAGCSGRSRLVAYHGEHDPLRAPGAAREILKRSCAGRGLGPDGFRVLAGEGHSPHRMDSWGAIYSAALDLMGGGKG